MYFITTLRPPRLVSGARALRSTAVYTLASCSLYLTCTLIVCLPAFGFSIVDLTVDDNFGSINGAWFVELDDGSTGTGKYNAFMQLQELNADPDKFEKGYNSAYGPTPDNPELGASGQHNHTIRWLDVPLVRNPRNNLGGQVASGWFAEFRSDINESGGASGVYLSLDRLEIWLSQYGDLGAPSKYYATWATLPNTSRIWHFGPSDGVVLMDYSLEAGSGSGDMSAYIPLEPFEAWTASTRIHNPYVYLYTQFGGYTGTYKGISDWTARDGFDEWGLIVDGSHHTPEPAAWVLFALGLGVVAGLRRRGVGP